MSSSQLSRRNWLAAVASVASQSALATPPKDELFMKLDTEGA